MDSRLRGLSSSGIMWIWWLIVRQQSVKPWRRDLETNWHNSQFGLFLINITDLMSTRDENAQMVPDDKLRKHVAKQGISNTLRQSPLHNSTVPSLPTESERECKTFHTVTGHASSQQCDCPCQWSPHILSVWRYFNKWNKLPCKHAFEISMLEVNQPPNNTPVIQHQGLQTNEC